MTPLILMPLEQLQELSKELLPIVNSLSSPLIIVGGQAVSYWMDYYKEAIQGLNTEQIASSDIDFMMTNRPDIVEIAKTWDVEPQFAGEATQPPSVAIALLHGPDGQDIKTSSSGAKFIDMDAFELEGTLNPNIVDFIDSPAGFERDELISTHKRALLTQRYEFPQNSTDSNDNLLILNPIGCLKSRIANLLKTNKPKEIEVLRIKALCFPIYFFIQDLYIDHEPKHVKRYLKLLSEIICSESGVQVFTHYGTDLRPALIDTLNLPNQPDKFYSEELPRFIAKLNDKFERRYAAHQRFLDVKARRAGGLV